MRLVAMALLFVGLVITVRADPIFVPLVQRPANAPAWPDTIDLSFDGRLTGPVDIGCDASGSVYIITYGIVGDYDGMLELWADRATQTLVDTGKRSDSPKLGGIASDPVAWCGFARLPTGQVVAPDTIRISQVRR